MVVLALVLSLGMLALPMAKPAESSSDYTSFVITANVNDRTVHTVDTATNTVYGPFLAGQLGTSGELLDVAVTPDNETALISNFTEQRVYFVDVSDPTNPSLLGSVDSSGLSFSPEDIAITSNGKYALISDGGPGASKVVSIDIASRTVVDSEACDSQAVAVAPIGIVILADFYGGELNTFTIDGSGNLTAGSTYTDVGLNGPINIGIAPDGQTVIVCNNDTTVAVYQVTGVGSLTYEGVVSGLPGGQQSVAFNESGTKAYVLSDPAASPQLSVLDITGPGEVSLDAAGVATLPGNTQDYFGVDAVAVADGTAYVGGNPGIAQLATVDLGDFSVAGLAVGQYPAGVASLRISAPQADFSAEPRRGNASLDVQFTDESSGDISTWQWDFGDGTTSNEQDPSHSYRRSGRYTVSLEVTGLGGTDTEQKPRYIAVTQQAVPAESEQESKSARFVTSALYILPDRVVPNQALNIYLDVTNYGNQGGYYNIALYINGEVEQSRNVTLGKGSTQKVVFQVAKAEPGVYHVSAAGHQGWFTVVNNEYQIVVGTETATGGGLNTGIIAGIIAGAVGAGIGVFFATRRRSI